MARHTFAKRFFAALAAMALQAAYGTVHAQQQLAADSAPVERLERIAPRSPEASRESIQTAPGFHVELVAAEPLLRSPVAIDFDEDGRMYVVEYPEYNDHAATRPHGHGAIRRLEDRDGDGRYEHSVHFADEIPFASGVCCYGGGVFVCAPPDLLYLKDTDGDGQADVRERVLTGFRRDHAGEGMFNSPRWGLDHRIHLCTGSAGGWVHRVDRSDEKPRSVRNMGLAIDPRTRQWSLTGGGGQYGLALDDWGRKFVCSNSTPIWQVMYDNRYLARNPVVIGPASVLSIAPEGKYTSLFRVSPVEKWRVAREQMRQRQLPGGSRENGVVSNIFTSGTGIAIYRGDAFPAEMRGQAFVGEVANNLIFAAKLAPSGVPFKALRALDQREFLASTDIWCRPCFVSNGPDGCLYAVDMYRELIEGAEFLPGDLLKQLDPSAGIDRGRIYRIVPDGFQRPQPPRLSRASTAELVSLLASRNGWIRDTASRLLSQRRDSAAVEPLHRLAAESPSALARLHALYTLQALGALRADEVVRASTDEAAELRENAAILAEPFAKDDAVLAALARLCEDPQIRVRCQAAFSLGYFTQPRVTELLARLAERDGSDPWVRLGILCSSAGRAGELFAALLEKSFWRASAAGKEVAGQLARQIGAARNDADVQRLVAAVNALPAADDSLAQQWVRRLVLGRPAQTPLPKLTGKSAMIWQQIIASAKRVAAEEQQDRRARAAAVATLAQLPLEEVQSTYEQLLAPRQPEAVQLAVVENLVNYRQPSVAELLLEIWPSLSPRVRGAAIETLLGRSTWAETFLKAIEAKRIARAEVDAGRVQLLQSFPDPAIRKLAQRVFAQESSSRPAEVVAQYKGALKMAGDVGRGREVFRKNCTACHQLEDVGRRLGAELHAIGDRGAESVLLNILDPNREVKPNYLVYVLSTVEGQVLSGLVTAETATSLSITQADGAHKTVLRSDIEELQNTGRSFMPEGLEKQISVPQMADLLAYLLAKKK